MPLVSIIIPCYNQGNYILETLKSVLDQTFQDYEIIVVNDGSTDEYTNNLLKNLNFPKTKVLTTVNQGLASARNNGIKIASGDIILPLDSDDKIHPEYIEKAVKILRERTDVRIVYCKAQLFGEKKGVWALPEYSFDEMLIRNLIFASAFYYKEDWDKVGGYKSNMISGWEDWDFWLSIIESGVKVYQIPEILFYYRIRKGSMAKKMSMKIQVDMKTQIFRNHQKLFVDNINIIFKKLAILDRSIIQRIKDDKATFFKKSIKNLFSARP